MYHKDRRCERNIGVVNEVAEDLLFLVGVDGAGRDDLGPFFELRAQSANVFGQAEPEQTTGTPTGQETVDAMGAALDAWAERPDAFSAITYGEAIGWVSD